ncbi:MAG: alpha/beta fold hydrolase [Actinomycetota bacterium]
MRRVLVALPLVLLFASALPAAAQTAPTHTAEDVVITSRAADGNQIAITVHKPGTASAESPVPVILQSHGWGGSRSASVTSFTPYLDAGLGVVSIDQRGHGDSGGEANVQDPELETEDVKAVIDYIATLDWVQLDGLNDPVLGAIGGSYGGGYQTMTALDEIADEGATRFNALVPEITWYDLPESLAPQTVVRTAWTSLLYAAGASMLPQYVHEAQAWGTATGQWPDGTLYGQPAPGIVPDLDAEFHEHSPVAFVERGVQIDVPVMVRQGLSDNLFNLNQGLDIFNKAVTDGAREDSIFIAYNGGHALPNVAPRGSSASGDSCVGDGGAWTQLRIAFFERVFAGESTNGLMPATYNFSSADGAECLSTESFDTTELELAPTGDVVVTPTPAGPPQYIELAQGPMTITGVPELSGLFTSAGLDTRAFFGLATGTSPADATVVQNNLMPLRALRTSVDHLFEIELPGVAIEVPEGQNLYLVVSPVSDMFVGHGTRSGSGLVLSDLALTLPAPAALPDVLGTVMTLVREGNGAGAQLVATLVDETGASVSGATIDFLGDEASLGAATTDEFGVAAIPLEGRYRGGKHAFEAIFAGTESHERSSASTT